MCLQQPLTTENCPKGRAGIATLYTTACENVLDIVFDANRQPVGFVMSALPGSYGFVKVNFEKNTANFEQPKTRVKNGTNIAQTITFIEPGLNATTRRLLEDLNDCCCSVVIVKDNNGTLHLAGVSYFPDTDTYQLEDMKTGEGSANTGTDPAADAAEYTETLTANTSFYAPIAAFTESQIPT